MLFITIMTWEPEQRGEIVKRRVSQKVPEGIKIKGEWPALSGGRSYTLAETDSPEAAMAAAQIYSDVAKIEIVPVIEVTEGLVQSIASQLRTD